MFDFLDILFQEIQDTGDPLLIKITIRDIFTTITVLPPHFKGTEGTLKSKVPKSRFEEESPCPIPLSFEDDIVERHFTNDRLLVLEKRQFRIGDGQ